MKELVSGTDTSHKAPYIGTVLGRMT